MYDSDTVIVHVIPLVSINTNTNSNQINLFPNPASEWFTIEFLRFREKGIMIRLFDQKGTEVNNDNFNIEVSNEKILLNISSLQQGIYYLEIITEKELFTGKILLQ